MTYFAGNCDFPGSIKSFDEMSFAEGLPIPGSDIRYHTSPESQNHPIWGGENMKKGICDRQRKTEKIRKGNGSKKVLKSKQKRNGIKAKIASSEE
jgi:hypothetical protein